MSSRKVDEIDIYAMAFYLRDFIFQKNKGYLWRLFIHEIIVFVQYVYFGPSITGEVARMYSGLMDFTCENSSTSDSEEELEVFQPAEGKQNTVCLSVSQFLSV